jgi:YD repeat-containing protein
MTIAQLLKHDFKSKGDLFLYDPNGNIIYREISSGHWYKQEYDSNGNRIYFENSNGYIIDNRPKASCDGKVLEIDGKKYKLTEI